MSVNLKKRIALVCLFISFFGMGQNPYFYTLDKSSGLPSNTVYDVFQDSKGFMWFATGKGICRFDGKKFIVYTSEEQTSVAGSSISEDRFGRVWYCNFDGYLYYVENGKLHPFNQPETIGYFRYGITEDCLYLIQKNKVLIYDLRDFSLIDSHKIEGETVSFTFSDEENFYVLADFLYSFSDKKLQNKAVIPQEFKKNYAAVVQKSPEGLLILSKYSGGYYIFKDGTFTKKQLLNKPKFTQNIVFLDNQPWICTTNGIIKNNFTENPKNYFSDYNISSAFKDNQGNYWIATLTKGLLLIEDFDSEFIPMSARPILLDFFDDDLLVSTEKDALLLFSTKNSSVSTFYQGTDNHSVNQLFVDNQTKKIFFTSSSFRVMNFNKKIETETRVAVKEIQKINEKYYSFSASGLSGIFANNSSEKNILDGLYAKKPLETNFGELVFLQQVNGKSTTFNPENKTIYYATNIGLFAQGLSEKKELFFNKKHLYISKLDVYKNTVFALSTNGKIYSVSEENIISAFNLPENIRQEKIFKIKIIANSLFIFGEKKILEYDFTKKQFREILFNSNEFDISDLVLYKSKIIFATSKGLLIKNKKNQDKTSAPKLIVNQVLVNNQDTSTEKLFSLENHQNNINIQFSVLAFVPNQKTEVWYRINDKKWQILDNESRNLMLNSLSFGSYKVDLKAKIDTNFSKTETVSFEIGKPIWLNPWFVFISALFALLVLYWGFRLQIKKERKQNQLALDRINLENSMNQSKLKAIKSQMNPHFFYNALNTIQSYILSNEKKTAVNYLSKFSVLTRTILEMTEKDSVTISEEIKAISLYLDIEKARFNDDFQYEIRSDENADFQSQKIPSMFLQPYIENAIKHGLLHKKEDKKLLISFEKLNEKILITIDDNGIGRKKSRELNAIKTKKHQSFATEAMQKRIDLLNQNKTQKITLTYIDKINEAGSSLGTTVIIEIPINYESNYN